MLSHPISENSKSWSNIRRNLLAVNENSDSLPPISERFDNLLIDAARVSEMMGRRSPGEVAFAQVGVLRLYEDALIFQLMQEVQVLHGGINAGMTKQ